MATTSCFTADEIKTFSTMFNKLMKSNDIMDNINILCIECIKCFPDEVINNVIKMITQHFEGMQSVLNKVKISRTETVNELLKKVEVKEEEKVSVNDMVEKVTGIQGCVMPSNESNDVNRMNKNAIIQAILLLENEMITFDDDDVRTLKYNSLNTVNKKQLILYLVDLQNSEVNVLKNGAAVKKMYLY